MPEWRYGDRILYVDLSARVMRVERTALEMKRSYIGGAGFVARLLADGCPGDVALAAGPLSHDSAGRLAMGARPVGGGPLCLSSLGGRMAALLGQCGFDALVLSGRLPAPGFLLLDESGVAFREAGAIWGLEIPDATDALGREAGCGYAAMVVGPAAEQRHPHATLAHEGHYAGGSGVAAALGAMRLKALLVRGAGDGPARCTACTPSCSNGPRVVSEIADRLGLEALAGRKRVRGGAPGVADLLGTCRWVWHERPGQVLAQALRSTEWLFSSR